MPGSFKDHFSGHATEYAAYRPIWPETLFAWLSQQSSRVELAWDCATGNGQAAHLLSRYYANVLATDASASQIENAEPGRGIVFRVEKAEHCSLEDSSTDLIVVAQAFHWFDHDAFLMEVTRVLRPAGLLAVMSYGLMETDPGTDDCVRRLWGEILDGWWPPERVWVDQGLSGINLPFEPVPAPRFEMTVQWNREQMTNYLGTWSAVRRFQKSEGRDPLALIAASLEAAWPDALEVREIRWPISLHVRRRAG